MQRREKRNPINQRYNNHQYATTTPVDTNNWELFFSK